MMLQRACRRPNAGAAVRIPARTAGRPLAPRWSRRPYTNGGGGGGSSTSFRAPQLVGVFLLSGAGGWAVSSLLRDGKKGRPSAAIPSLVPGPVDLEALAKSPVDEGSFAKADAKLREDVFVGSFGAEGKDTHVHAARVASNHPVEDYMAYSLAPGVGGSQTLFNGVYDGHAGWATSLLLKSALIPAVSSSIARLQPGADDAAVEAAVVRAFTDLDDRIMANAVKAVDGLEAGAVEPGDSGVMAAIAPAIAGSCALLSIFDPATSTVRVACTGDSRAVLGSAAPGSPTSYSALELSKDQTGRNQDEFDRVSKEHPGEDGILDRESGRLLGIAVTRAFGDHRWKWTGDLIKHVHLNFFGTSPRPKYATPPYMTAAPVVTAARVRGPDFVILASDGLWDHISSEHAVECVSRWLSARRAGEGTPGDKLARTPASPSAFDTSDGWPNWSATPEHFVVEDLDNAAVHLIKNALGGARRTLFTGAALAYAPLSRNVRDDVTVQVIFFQDPSKAN
ncbi:protein phosphatase 2C [Colletotrichum zoysiae]|uniref:Protein phosphatase 2C n=1 Tax=Colletotrichum zoysiae TaxID=1216348 RepID=A0AAD9HDZ6_9PEZI|nr:protein phosphatase 2C [Colletotrichum zoysiae]